MHEAPVNHVHARDEVEHVAGDARRRQGRQAPGVVDGERPCGTGERDALDPFHDERGRALDGAASVQAREPLQAGKAAVAFVFMLEGGAKPGDAALIGVGRLVLVPLGQREQLDRKALPLRVARAGDAGHAAALLVRIGDEQRDEPAHVGRLLIGRDARSGFEVGDAHHAHTRGGSGKSARMRAGIQRVFAAHRPIPAYSALNFAAAVLFPAPSWSSQMGAIHTS